MLSNYLIAQTQDKWTSFTISDGLANHVVQTICESSDGAIWFGTKNGVSHFQDGNWTTITTTDRLAGNNIKTIIESSDGALWFGTDGGGISQYKNGKWKTFTTTNSLASNKVYAIIESGDGVLWFACFDGGISRFQNGVWTSFTSEDGLVSNKVQTICESSDGALWVGTEEGISRYHGDGWATFNKADSLISNNVLTICESSDGILWLGTDKGVSCYQNDGGETFSTVDDLAGKYIQTIYESTDGALWFGTRFGGVSRYLNKNWTTFTETANGLVNSDVQAIIESNDGALWFATARGVSRYLAAIWRTFNTTDEPALKTIRAIFEASDRAIWVGTDKGVCRYQSGTWTTFTTNNGLASNDIHAICESSDGALWFGDWGVGVSRYKDGIWTTFSMADGLADMLVNTICESSSDSALWFGTMGGVSRYKDGIFTTIDALEFKDVRTICESSDGALWFGIYRGGVSRYKDGIWTPFSMPDGLVDDWVNTICESYDGFLWFGTALGVSRYRDGMWTSFTTFDGLADNNVKTICESGDSSLWFGTDGGGVSRYQNEMWTTITTIDGLVSYNVTAICDTYDGALWFGTANNGISRFKPDKNPPFIFFTKVPKKITGNPSPLFVFKGRDYQTEESKILYSYAVVDSFFKPEKKDYSSFSDKSFVELPPQQNGTYTFYVRAQDKMGNISKPASYTFTVDVTHPTAIINYPLQDDTLSQSIKIIGSAYDDSPTNDFDYYGLCYSLGTVVTAETKWDTLISQMNEEKRNDTLATWDTERLQGSYLLKLFAKDMLGHQSEDIITVHIVDLIGEIKNTEGGKIGDAANNIEIYFPPNSFSDNIELKVNFVSGLNSGNISNEFRRYAGLAFDIMPEHIEPQKSGTLSITYVDTNLSNIVDEKRLSIFRYEDRNNDWLFRGGTVDIEHHKITSSITQLGRYGLFENMSDGTKLSLSKVNCQPRLFSPKSSSYAAETAISFELGKQANVTIKIYNTAGRLVRALKENEAMCYGNKVVFWNGKNKWGKFCVSGLYIVTIQAEDKMETKTVVVLNKY